ncbi:MAG TPA: hypothetical protein VFP05_11455 [Thermomicrobiales bacterium]|nr:hypothetical protein [Thermomicrobiales bacterium]
MDGQRFDAMTRALATSANRRRLLKGMFGLGSVALAGSRLDAEAARRGFAGPRRSTPPSVACPSYPTTCWRGSQPFDYGCRPSCWNAGFGVCGVCQDLLDACCADQPSGQCDVVVSLEACEG